ncbi:signal transduction histidine kinase CheA [Desulfocucumis palustris]|uniref:Stage 0 sporulation protein A homolog n=1 Tax=Desulfocucumis palustris TaxID=1898651 RepID=A0A2L2XD03_9FIRM|nr:chemotaxis protein CheW [Desulfocucumis palustris]GBF32106.1 signal transduction histidine kinase CheA [Desulfocucumis palustris]
MNNQELISNFVEEVTGHVDAVEAGLLRLEGGNGDAEVVHGVFRSLHSIKGTAGFFDLANIVELSHTMENLFGEIRNGNVIIDSEMIDTLLSANDCLKKMISDVYNSHEVDISDYVSSISSLLQSRNEENQTQAGSLEQVEEASSRSAGSLPDFKLTHGHRPFKMNFSANADVAALTQKIGSIGNVIGLLVGEDVVLFSSVLEKGLVAAALDIDEDKITELTGSEFSQFQNTAAFRLPGECVPVGAEGFAGPQGEPAEAADNVAGQPAEIMDGAIKRPARTGDDTVRVHVSLLNDLLNLASEMVLGRNQLFRILESYRKAIPGVKSVLQNIDAITTELQEKIMLTRMQPVAKVFNKFPRIIREISKKLGKDIELQMEGSEVELDKSIIEQLADPLTHLVRNAADHGIELPEEREEKGKPRTGKIKLRAYHESGYVNIDIIDDGKGIDIENIKSAALKKGFINQAEIPTLGERDFLELLFHPGFSTAGKVTDFSGRGVGMDVVKTNIEKLGGTMEIMTCLGQGTTLRLNIPLTLAIISSLIVDVQGQKFALPQVNLQGLVRIKPGGGNAARRIEQVRGADVLRFRGKLLPIVHLGGILGLKREEPDKNGVMRVLVIKSGSKLFGLVVDVIHDWEEILVKPVPRYLKGCQCYSGVTIMGDGRTAMILDPEGIASAAGLRFADEARDLKSGDLTPATDSMAENQNLLLFKCSGPEILAIDLSMVSRVEKISSGQIERIGSKEFIQFRGEALRIIRPENYLPITAADDSPGTQYVIVPKMISHTMGILTERIIDTTERKIKFGPELIKNSGIFGSMVLDGRIVVFINIYELFEMAAQGRLKKDAQAIASKNKRILLAEDTPFFMKMEKEYLESEGYEVLAAVNGREAWQLLQENHVDLLISDIEMPLMDGFELMKRVRGDKNLASLPAIAVTSMSDEKSARKGMEAGFNFYEIKLDKERLLDKVKTVLKKRGDVL